ncbi:hypothetical protein ACVWXL_008215 [Bradyrhizobium sp. GM22.5]
MKSSNPNIWSVPLWALATLPCCPMPLPRSAVRFAEMAE